MGRLFEVFSDLDIHGVVGILVPRTHSVIKTTLILLSFQAEVHTHGIVIAESRQYYLKSNQDGKKDLRISSQMKIKEAQK